MTIVMEYRFVFSSTVASRKRDMYSFFFEMIERRQRAGGHV